MDPTSRLRIATRIHFALLRHFNEDVDVRTLLLEGIDAQEALWVCEGSGNPELLALAQQFTLACQTDARAGRNAAAAAVAAPTVPQDLRWSEDTSGFGLSRPLPDVAMSGGGATVSSAWSRPMSWLRRGSR